MKFHVMTWDHSMSYIATANIKRIEFGHVQKTNRQLMPEFRDLLVQDLHCEEEETILCPILCYTFLHTISINTRKMTGRSI